MKKALSVIGGLFLVLLVAGGGMLGYAAFEGSKLDAESKAYVEATLPKFLSNPTADSVLSFMAPQDKANVKASDMLSFSSYISQNLGAFQSYDDMKGDALIMFSPNGKDITAKYLVHCYFDKASVTATVSLRKVGDAWSLMGVFFDSNSLGPTRNGGKSI
jgi:hypothetical protein